MIEFSNPGRHRLASARLAFYLLAAVGSARMRPRKRNCRFILPLDYE